MEQNKLIDEENIQLLTQVRDKVQTPSLYQVLLHNDDYTTQEFVVQVLTSIFHKSESEAIQVMLQIHLQGIGVAGRYSYEIAETKVAKVLSLAKQYEFPLQCTLERE